MSKLETSFFQDHPERRDDEVYIGNYTEGWCNQLDYVSYRLGKIARNELGEELEQYYSLSLKLYPVFISKSDYIKR
jgi:mRNA deadenylase 3'-5' endonuclease subunit Ccr4